MAIACSIISTSKTKPAKQEELADAMHKQWQIQGNCERTSKKIEDNVHTIALIDVNEEENTMLQIRFALPEENLVPPPKESSAQQKH